MKKVFQKQVVASVASTAWASAQRLMRPHGWFCLTLVALVAILLWRGLVSSTLVVSQFGYDGSSYMYHIYSYIQEGYASGELRTWNPFMYSGTPVIGSFQYTPMYPLRWLCALLPMPASLNWMLFLHICLAGVAMYAWVFSRSKSAPGAFTAGVIYMFCGSLFARVPVGHFTLVYTMAWIPLIFCGIDGWCRQRRIQWLLLASLSAALQIFAGHPQYYYNTMLMAAVYSLLTLLGSERKIKTAAGLLAIYPLAALLAAVELVPGYLYSQEAVRAGGMTVEWAAMASMQFKDLLRILVPNFFGGIKDQFYWDNLYLWEMWNYSGLGGLFLAFVGFLKILSKEKVKFLFLAILTLTLALGVHTPLFGVLREYMPMYSSFRVMGRWTIFFTLFVALLAGTGVAKIASGEKIPHGITWGALGLGLVFLLSGLILLFDNPSDWYRSLADKLTLVPRYRLNLHLVDKQVLAQGNSANALCLSGGLAVILGLISMLVKQRKWLAGLLIAITVADLMVFAAPMVSYFNKSLVEYPAFAGIAKKFPPDTRNLNLVNPAADITLKSEGIWGFEAIVSRRYLELMAAGQGFIPPAADMPLHNNTSIFKLLRGRYAFISTGQGVRLIELHKDVLPRFFVTGNYRVLTNRDEILRTLTLPNSDYRGEVILEKHPGIRPSTAVPKYKVNVLSSSPARWVVEVETSTPGVLVMTDSYAKGWHARPLSGSVQTSYDLQPADWAVRGIPLRMPGRHLIEIKYTPPGLSLGLLTSLATLGALAVFVALALRRRFAACQQADNHVIIHSTDDNLT